MKKRKGILVCLATIVIMGIAATAWGAAQWTAGGSNGGFYTIKGLELPSGNTGYRLWIDGSMTTGDVAGCTSGDYLNMDASTANATETDKLVMGAYLAGKKVQLFMATGCRADGRRSYTNVYTQRDK